MKESSRSRKVAFLWFSGVAAAYAGVKGLCCTGLLSGGLDEIIRNGPPSRPPAIQTAALLEREEDEELEFGFFDMPFESGFSDQEIAQGFVVVGTGSGESFDFEMPEGATVVESWRRRGAHEDWECLPTPRREGTPGTPWVVFPNGTVRDYRLSPSWVFSPLGLDMSLAPEANWGLLGSNVASRVWTLEKRDSWVVTWENALVGRETNDLVSVQAEFFDDGRIVYRYGAMSDAVKTNATVGLWHDGIGEAVDLQEEPNLTSVWFYCLQPSDLTVYDEDGDGLSTWDEIFEYRTNPHVADSDGDGRSDGEEVAGGRNPLEREESDAVIRAMLQAAATNLVEVGDVVYEEGELRARQLWPGFAFEVGDLVGGEEIVIYERILDVDRKGGWQEFFLSSRGDSARAWRLDGCWVSWEDDCGNAGVLSGSPAGDSVRLPLGENASMVTIRIVAEPGFVRSLQPVYLVEYTPHFEVLGARAVAMGNGHTAYVVIEGEGRVGVSVGIDRSLRPCNGSLEEGERGDEDYPIHEGAGVWPVCPWNHGAANASSVSRLRRSASNEEGGDIIVKLDPSISYGSPHPYAAPPLVWEDGAYRRVSRFPLEDGDSGWGWWSDFAAMACGCEPSVSCSCTDRSFISAEIVERDASSATGIVTVFGEEVWRGYAYHQLLGWDVLEVLTNGVNGCESSCMCSCKASKDGDSTGSMQFKVGLGTDWEGKGTGYVWFRTEGPALIAADALRVMSRDGGGVTVSTNGAVRTVSCSASEGRDVEIFSIAGGARVTLGRHWNSEPIASWDITNVDGDPEVIRVQKRDAVGSVSEATRYTCSTNDIGGWVWTVLNEMTGTFETVEHRDVADAEGGRETIRNRYSADGALVGGERIVDAVEVTNGGERIVEVLHERTLRETDVRGKVTEIVVTKFADREETVRTETGPDVASVVETVVTRYVDGREVRRKSWDGKWVEESWLGEVVVASASDRTAVTNLVDEAASRIEDPMCVVGFDDEERPVCSGNTNYTYNAAGDLVGLSVVEDGTNICERTFAYDSWGRVVEVMDSVEGSLTLTYDGVGNVTEVTAPCGTARMTYDTAGERTALDLSDWFGEVPAARAMRRMARSAGALEDPPLGHLDFFSALEHYTDGTGTPVAIPFDDVNTTWVRPEMFPCVTNVIAHCHRSGSYAVRGGLLIHARAPMGLVLGNVTIRVDGTVSYTSCCQWNFTGTLTCHDDSYDFEAASRGITGETLSKWANRLVGGKPYVIQIRGEKQLTGSGSCRGGRP